MVVKVVKRARSVRAARDQEGLLLLLLGGGGGAGGPGHGGSSFKSSVRLSPLSMGTKCR